VRAERNHATSKMKNDAEGLDMAGMALGKKMIGGVQSPRAHSTTEKSRRHPRAPSSGRKEKGPRANCHHGKGKGSKIHSVYGMSLPFGETKKGIGRAT